MAKLLLGKLHAAFTAWGNCCWGNYCLGKLLLGKLAVGEIAFGEVSTGEVALGKWPNTYKFPIVGQSAWPNGLKCLLTFMGSLGWQRPNFFFFSIFFFFFLQATPGSSASIYIYIYILDDSLTTKLLQKTIQSLN